MANNPLFNAMGGNQSPANSPNMIQQIMQFKNSIQGDLKQHVQALLNSGKMTQDQFNQLSVMAKQLESLFSGK